jgi:hypothetical protein
MARFRGTLRRNDLEGGHWQLVTDDGAVYVLAPESLGSEADVTLVDGVRVEIEGSMDRKMLSFAMTGPMLVAKSIKGI